MTPTPADRPPRVYLEEGERWVFAVAMDWPGWCRRGRGAEDALSTLDAYRDRYGSAVGRVLPAGDFEVIGSVAGTRTTDFGAPDVRGPWDAEPPTGAELDRQVDLLEASWRTLDAVVAASGPDLRKGPRGGGRDRDGIVAHVREAERSWAPKVGTRFPPRTPWAEQRAGLVAVLRDGPVGTPWPVGYTLRRMAWHVLDHAWEIEDKQV